MMRKPRVKEAPIVSSLKEAETDLCRYGTGRTGD